MRDCPEDKQKKKKKISRRFTSATLWPVVPFNEGGNTRGRPVLLGMSKEKR